MFSERHLITSAYDIYKNEKPLKDIYLQYEHYLLVLFPLFLSSYPQFL